MRKNTEFNSKDLKWIREPKNYSITENKIEIVTEPHTDLWQRTYYNFRNDNAPVLQINTDEKYFSFIVKCHDGIQGLVSKKQSGRPSRLTDEQEAELVQIVAYHTPEEVGFKSRANWTLAIVCDLILRRWGYGYTQKGVADLLHRLGLSWTRPTYTLKKSGFQETTGVFGRNLPEPKKNC
jgi:hypothetical protein